MNERHTKKSWASTAPSTLRSSGTHRHRRKTSTLLISKKKVMQRILETWHTGEQESAQLLCTPKQNCRIWKRVKKLWLRKWDRAILKESELIPNVDLCLTRCKYRQCASGQLLETLTIESIQMLFFPKQCWTMENTNRNCRNSPCTLIKEIIKQCSRCLTTSQ